MGGQIAVFALSARGSKNRGLTFSTKCCFTIGLGNLVIEKIGLAHLDASTSHTDGSVEEWWANRTVANTPNRKAMASLAMLVSWIIWNEMNSKDFHQNSAPSMILLNNILTKAHLWAMAGVRKLRKILVRE